MVDISNCKIFYYSILTLLLTLTITLTLKLCQIITVNNIFLINLKKYNSTHKISPWFEKLMQK